MVRLSLILQLSAICVFFLAQPNNGSRPRSWNQEDPFTHDMVHGLAKQQLMKLRSNSSHMATVSGQDSESDEAVYFANHRTYSGGPDDSYYGIFCMMDVYGHKLERGQWTSTGIWVSHPGDGAKSSLNSVDAGWHIYPELYGDTRPHFFTYWTRDGYEKTGCFNMACPGFVPVTGAKMAPGAVIDPVSDVNNGNLQSIIIKVFKEKTSGDWWVYYGFNTVPTAVGYYPKSLFTNLSEKATEVSFGGFVVANRTLPTPPMGSGTLPDSSQGRAASFRDLRLLDQDGIGNPVTTDFPINEGNKECYAISPIAQAECFYGGPGGCV